MPLRLSLSEWLILSHLLVFGVALLPPFSLFPSVGALADLAALKPTLAAFSVQVFLTSCCLSSLSSYSLCREGELLREGDSTVREESCLHCGGRRRGRRARLEKGEDDDTKCKAGRKLLIMCTHTCAVGGGELLAAVAGLSVQQYTLAVKSLDTLSNATLFLYLFNFLKCR